MMEDYFHYPHTSNVGWVVITQHIWKHQIRRVYIILLKYIAPILHYDATALKYVLHLCHKASGTPLLQNDFHFDLLKHQLQNSSKGMHHSLSHGAVSKLIFLVDDPFIH